MGTTCSQGTRYIYVLDGSGKGFTAADMDLWDWEGVVDFAKDKPVKQAELDRAHGRFRELCVAASRRKGGRRLGGTTTASARRRGHSRHSACRAPSVD